MQTLLKKVARLLALLAVSSFGLLSHAVAISAPVHGVESNGTVTHHQSTNNSVRCLTLCTSVVFNKEELQRPDLEDDEDTPFLPFYSKAYSTFLEELDAKGKAYAVSVKPPPKVPIYILHSVFRS